MRAIVGKTQETPSDSHPGNPPRPVVRYTFDPLAAAGRRDLHPGAGPWPRARNDWPMSFDWFNTVVVPVAQFIGTVGGLLFVWWQVRQIPEVNAYGLLRDEV